MGRGGDEAAGRSAGSTGGEAAATASSMLARPPSEAEGFRDLYPQRKQGSQVRLSVVDYATGKGQTRSFEEVCGSNVIRCVRESPLIRLMLSALRSHGCDPDPYFRHLSCDTCAFTTAFESQGNYDDAANQVFVCANNAKSYGAVHGSVLRNLVTMFDYCANRIDFQNPDHLACSEIRKANLASCNFLVYFARSDANFAVSKQHSRCVRNTAVDFMVQSKFVDRTTAEQAVDRVFERCYNDLEPIGRRCNSQGSMRQAFKERYLFGYS